MTFNELAAVFASDDLNPNSELIFHIDDDINDKFIIDDVVDSGFVSISLGRRDNEN